MKKPGKASVSNSTWAEDASQPCDPDLFLMALQAWQKGREVPLPHVGTPKVPGRLYLNDEMPDNRSATHTIKVLKEAGVSNPQAYLWRIIHLPEIFEAADELGLADMVREDAVATPLLKAAAVAKLQVPPTEVSSAPEGSLIFDLQDVAARAWEYAKASE